MCMTIACSGAMELNVKSEMALVLTTLRSSADTTTVLGRTCTTALLRDRQRGDQAISVAAIDRLDELNDRSVLRVRDALESKRR